MKKITTKGFTLIELLVVISIIGLLSSVVLASLNSARGKARDTAIKSQVQQLRRLLELNYSDYGNYDYFKIGWVHPNPSSTSHTDYACSTITTGNYAAQTRALCDNLLTLIGSTGLTTSPGVDYLLYFGGTQPFGSQTYTYSVMAVLPGAKQWYCVGSSGASSQVTTYTGQQGCWNNP